jgi:hypothetical protein
MLGARRLQIDRNSNPVNRERDEQSQPKRILHSQSVTLPAGNHGHVRPVRHKVQHPVCRHTKPRNPSPTPTAPQSKIQSSKRNAPQLLCHQTMGTGIRNEIQRSDPYNSRRNPHLLPSPEQKNGPEQIGNLRRENQDAERRPRRSLLRCQPNSRVAEKRIQRAPP